MVRSCERMRLFACGWRDGKKCYDGYDYFETNCDLTEKECTRPHDQKVCSRPLLDTHTPLAPDPILQSLSQTDCQPPLRVMMY